MICPSIDFSRLAHFFIFFSQTQACKPAFPLQIAVEAPSMQEHEAIHLVRTTQHAIDDLNEFSAHHLRLGLSKTKEIRNVQGEDQTSAMNVEEENSRREQRVALKVRLLAEDTATAFRVELQPQSKLLDVFYASGQAPSISSSTSALANFIAIKLQDLFAEEQATLAYILSSGKTPTKNYHMLSGHVHSSQSSQTTMASLRDPKVRSGKNLRPDLAARLAKQMTRSLKYAPTYHLTISLFTPGASPSSWDIESALVEYMIPLLDSLSDISNFTIDTQVQMYAAISPSVQSPEQDTEKGVWTLREEDLSSFINAAEWPLSPSIGAGPTLNFIIYVPDPKNAPLVIKGSQASSWLIPQWGGIYILNPLVDPGVSTTVFKLSKEEIQPALLTFSHQLLSFLGAPQSPPSLPLQLQTLTRLRAASLLLSASSTMGSLARLTVALPSIAIPETVSTAVDSTLTYLKLTCDALKDGRFDDALNTAREAETQAERGFFEKSMVGQVYFPDEHKIAVYLPLLGPIGVPMIMGAVKEIRKVLALRRASRFSQGT